MTRIVAGSAGGRTLVVPRHGTRPTSERVREALFSRLEHRGVIAEARVLDLYAGSGALGLEAASRGASSVTLVESSRDAADVCRRNATALGLADRVRVAAEKVEQFVARPVAQPWRLVMLDPPYDLPAAALDAVLVALAAVVDPDGLVVVERSTRSPEPGWPAGLTRDDDRRYGDTRMWFAVPAPVTAGSDPA